MKIVKLYIANQQENTKNTDATPQSFSEDFENHVEKHPAFNFTDTRLKALTL